MTTDPHLPVSALSNPEDLLAALAAISLQFHTAPDVETLLQAAVQTTQQLIHSDRLVVYQLLPDGDGVIAAEVVRPGIVALQGQLIYDPCFKTHWDVPYQAGRTRQIDDVETAALTPCYRALLRRFQVRANLVVPILNYFQSADRPPSRSPAITHDPQLWGVLIAHECQRPRFWQARDRQILQFVALQIGLALHQLNQTHALAAAQQAEASVRAELAQITGIVDIANDAIIAIADDQRITLFNQGAERIFGYAVAEVLHQPLDMLLPERFSTPHQSHIQAFGRSARAARRMGSDRSLVYGRRKDGTEFPAEVSISKLRHGNHITYTAILRDISQQKQVEAALHLQNERERMIATIAQEIRRSLDLNHILQTTVEQVRRFLAVERVIIYRFTHDWSGLVLTESVAPGMPAILGKYVTDAYFVETQGRHYQSGYVKAVPDIYTAGLSECHVQLMEELHIRAKLVVPIQVNDHLWGLLVAHQGSAPRDWQTVEGDLLTQLATQVAIAIQQAELYAQVTLLNTTLEQQVQERTAQLQQALDFEAIVKRITDQLRDSLDEATILQLVVQELAIALKAEICDVALYNAERTIATIQHQYIQGQPIGNKWSCDMANGSDPHLYEQFFQGRSCLFCLTEKNVLRPDDPPRTILACPIVDDQDVLGDLWLFRSCDDVFTESEIRLVQQVANQCAIALRQSRLYQAAQAQVQELERLNRLKDDFLSTVSHELRTPIASIKMATQMLEISLHALGLIRDADTPVSRYLKILDGEADRELQLVNDLLELTLVESGTERPEWRAIALQNFLPHVAEPYLLRFQQQQQQFNVVIPDDLPSLVSDQRCLARIITELLHNALKYTPTGASITLIATFVPDRAARDPSVEHSDASSLHPAIARLVSPAGRFQIRVVNAGVEIPASERDRIFDKFYRIPQNDPWQYGGTGLGLALVRRLATLLHGTITVSSQQNITCFTLELPSQA